MNHWTGPQAAQIAGVTYDTLNYWVKHGLLSPSTPASSPRHWSYYSLSNIVTITAIKTLRAQGVSLQTLRKAGTELGLRIDISLEQGLQGGVIVADRHQVLAVLYTLDDAVQIMSLLKGGQMVLPLDSLVDKVKQQIEKMYGEEQATIEPSLPKMVEVQHER